MTLALRRRDAASPALLLAACATLVLLLPPAERRAPGGAPPARQAASEPAFAEAKHPSLFYDARLFASAEAALATQPVRPMPGVRAIIVPHHLLAAPLILGPLRDLAATRTIRRLVVVGPNHTNSGGAPIITSERGWMTPYGGVAVDAQVTQALRAGGAAAEPDVITYEHSVAAIVPAIARELPGASVATLIVKSGATPAELERIAAALGELLLDDGTVLVAAIDFSHGLPEPTARSRNAESIALLRSMDAWGFRGLSNEYLDSPASATIALLAASAAGATAFELRADSTSADFLRDGGGAVTSYVSGYLY